MNYKEWEAGLPSVITGDPLWKVEAYRLALLALDIGWKDVTQLFQDKRTVSSADQLYRALGSIGANIAEGYGRQSHKERARFYEYALGSARESRHWYYQSRHVLAETIVAHRLDLLTQIVKLLTVMVPDQRQRGVREDQGEYRVNTEAWLDNITYDLSD